MTTPNGRAAVNTLFGNPDRGGKLDPVWYNKNIVSIALPEGMKMVQSWDNVPIRKILVHRLLAASLTAVLAAIWGKARADVKAEFGFEMDTAFYDAKTNALLAGLGLSKFGGSFNFRPVRGRGSLSLHSYGIAIDLDPEGNGLGQASGAMPPWVIAIFETHGWFWGGNFKGRKDPMHFQFATGC